MYCRIEPMHAYISVSPGTILKHSLHPECPQFNLPPLPLSFCHKMILKHVWIHPR